MSVASGTTGVKQAKDDLMQLGIELDDRLIERLQNNLGIHKIFSVARDVSHIIKTKPKLPTGAVAEMSFRYVAPEAEQENKSTAHTVNPFRKELFQLDGKLSISILRRLEDRSIDIEPQHRPHIEKMIESFQVQYGRSPERFVGRLLGQKWSLAERKNPDLIAKAVLQNRFINKDDFKSMVKRVYTNVARNQVADEVVLESLFKLLAEEKQFASAKNRYVVDLWSLLTLIKAATEESRRSYDGKTSQLAADVEFWKRLNNVANPIPGDSRTLEDASSSSAPSLASGRAQSAPRPRPRPTFVNAKSVAELLGQPKLASTHQLRVKGTLSHELSAAGSVAAAFGNDVPPNPPSPLRDQNWWKKESKIPLPPPDNMLDSSKISFLMGQPNHHNGIRADSRPRSSPRCLMKAERDKSSVAEALGLNGERHAPSTQPTPPSNPKKDVATTGNKIGARHHSVDTSSRAFSENIDYIFDKMHPARVHDKRLKFRSSEQLHWGDKPSVASALNPHR